ncbi:MAG: hypothetical protein ACXVAY_14400 [Mucilaginibacter sp.]
MKTLFLTITLIFSVFLCFSQSNLVSYEDLKYILHNNLAHADTFFTAKGYALKSKNDKTKNREYSLAIQGGTYVNVHLRADGKKLFMEIETNELSQYNLINNSISQYINKAGSVGDVQTYNVKDLCSIYITIGDTVPYSPIRKDYDMQIVADKNVIAYN